MTVDHQIIWREVKDYIFITLGLLLYTFGWTVFLLPYEIVTGGVTGLSAIIFYATRFPIQDSYLFINIALLVVALKILGWKFMIKTIYAIFTLYLMLKYAQELMPRDPKTGDFIQILGANQDFMSLIIGCCFTGTSLAIVFLNNGYSSLRKQVLQSFARTSTYLSGPGHHQQLSFRARIWRMDKPRSQGGVRPLHDGYRKLHARLCDECTTGVCAIHGIQ